MRCRRSRRGRNTRLPRLFPLVRLRLELLELRAGAAELVADVTDRLHEVLALGGFRAVEAGAGDDAEPVRSVVDLLDSALDAVLLQKRDGAVRGLGVWVA